MGVEFVKSERVWKYVLGVGVATYLLLRLLTLMSFPVFNDEANFLQYSQAVHSDFAKYKYVSEGAVIGDWKPPLQPWIGAVFFGIVSDPLLAGRLASAIVSLFGLWGLYLFVKELLGTREAAIAVLLYAICPTALFYNNEFVGETFVFSFAPWMYWSLLRGMRAGTIAFQWLVPASIFGALILLSKQSGMVYVGLAMVLPIVTLWPEGDGSTQRRWQWKAFSINLGAVAVCVFAATLLRRLGVSPETAALEQQFTSNWVMSIQQVLDFPWDVWRNNATMVGQYYYSYYSVFIIVPLGYLLLVAALRRKAKDLVLAIGFLASSGAVIFILRGFNEYMYNTAVIIFLISLLARSLVASLDSLTAQSNVYGRLFWLVPAFFVLLAGHWIYQDALIKLSPAGYIRRSTPWAVSNYLEGWAGGFGVPETLAYLRTQAGPGLVLADPQWGNPRTTLEVYNPKYPRLRVVPINADFRTEAGTNANKNFILTQPFKQRLVVFSGYPSESRLVWQRNIEKYMCDTRKEIQVEPTQPPIVVCSF